MKLKDILKIVGAGITGGYLALKIRNPRRGYHEFVQLYCSISIEFQRQFETVVLQTMLPVVPEDDRPTLFQLLDRHATFPEQLRFFQAHLENFDELIVTALRRIYHLREQGLIAPTARKRLRDDPETFEIGVQEVFYDLERSFLEALTSSLPPEEREAWREEVEPAFLIFEELLDRDESPRLPEIFFDGYSRFTELMERPSLRNDR